MSLGPLISQIAQALTSVIGSILVAKSIGQIGVEVYGAVYTVEFFAVAIAQFLSAGLSVRLSYLYGAQELESTDQLFVDFLRLSVILGIITPCIVLPVTKPVIWWFGADELTAELSLQYMSPITGACLFNIIFLVSSGVILADGKSVTYAIFQVASFVLNIGVFSPILLLGIKTPIWGASLATILSQAIPGIFITVMIFKGKFRLHPTINMFWKPFCVETKHALKIGFSTLISQISLTLPFLLMQKYVNNAAMAIGQYGNAVAVWAVVEKLYLIIGGICIGFSTGFLNPGSYAFGAKNYKRFFKLMIHGIWLCTASCLVISVVIISVPVQISKLWSQSESFLEMSKKITPILYFTAFTLGMQYMVPVVLQASKKIFASSTLSVLTLVLPVPIFSTILYFTGDGKMNPQRIFYTYTCNDSYSFIVCTLFFISPLKKMIKAMKTGSFEDEEDLKNEIDNEEESVENMDEQERPATEI